MPERITLYTSKPCPYAHRVEIALAEAGADFKRFEIDLTNKPEWYAPKVNPASKVPAIAYGGPDVPPDQPSPDSTKIAESLVLVELVADLFPDSGLLPKDPVQRAKARFFIEGISSKLNPAWFAFLVKNGPAEDVFAAFDYLQALLPPSGWAVGEFSIADVALLPFLARIRVALALDIEANPEGRSKDLITTLHSERYTRFIAYTKEGLARPSFVKTWDEQAVKEHFKFRFARRAEAEAAAAK